MALRVASLFLLTFLGMAFLGLARRFLDRKWALFAALVFIAHPSQVASAAFPSAINNLFSAIFIFVYCRESLEYLATAANPGGRLGFVALAGLLALWGYELGVVILPLSVLIALWSRRHAAPWSRILMLTGMTGAIVFLYILYRAQMGAIGELVHPMLPRGTSGPELSFSAPYYTLKHLWMWVFPVGQGGILLSDDPRGAWLSRLPFWGVLGGLVWIAFRSLVKHRRRWGFGFLFFVCAMTPLSNWIPLWNGPITNYYLLVPSGGLALIGALLLQSLEGRVSKRTNGIVCGGFVILLVMGSIYRVSWWSDQYRIYEFTVRNHPQNWVAWNNWGVALIAKGERGKALEAFERSSRLADWYIEPLENQMWLHLMEGRPGEVLRLSGELGNSVSSGIAAAMTIASVQSDASERAFDWAQRVDPGLLRPGQRTWFETVVDRLEAER